MPTLQLTSFFTNKIVYRLSICIYSNSTKYISLRIPKISSRRNLIRSRKGQLLRENADVASEFSEDPRFLKEDSTLTSIKTSRLYSQPSRVREFQRFDGLRILDMQVLCLLQMQQMSGYELRKNIERTFGYEISFGTLYPHLRTLENSRLIAGKWMPRKPRKRMYGLTERGKEVLRTNAHNLSRLIQLILSGAKEDRS